MLTTNIDNLGRRANYLRLSLTDACNLSCVYCKTAPMASSPSTGVPPLSIDEIARLVGAACDLGITKIRLTGGEPTLRDDLVAIVARLTSLGRLQAIAMTTHGLGLTRLAPALRGAGLTALNVSLDSLQPARFARITGSRFSPSRVLAGIDAALTAGFTRVAVNVVLLADLGAEEREAFFELARTRPLSIRFIELMRTAANTPCFENLRMGAAPIAALLTQRGFIQESPLADAGPARIFRHDDYRGTIGIISPYLASFCGSCNRLRVDAQARLLPCLFAEKSIPLRNLLADDADRDHLLRQMALGLSFKPAGHSLESETGRGAASFRYIGG